MWRHTRKGDKYVTVIIDLTGVRDGTGTARLLDMIDGRSKAVFKTWLGQRDQAWRVGIEAIAMDGFPRCALRTIAAGGTPPGFKTAAVEEVPQAVTVMGPFLPRKREVPPSRAPGGRCPG